MAHPLQHLLSIQALPLAEMHRIFERAELFATDPAIAHALTSSQSLAKRKYTNLLGRQVFNLFFEPSTRTLTTFAISASRLSADVQNLNIANSSQTKGETMQDTIANLMAMGADYFIIRHSQDGAVAEVADFVGNRVHVINAGDGKNEHPTQGLLDMYTLRHFLGVAKEEDSRSIAALSVAVVGDVRHSRVARSDIAALKKLGVEDIRVIAPHGLLPDDLAQWGVTHEADMNRGLASVDAIFMLRIQRERMEEGVINSFADYYQQYGLTQERLAFAKPHAKVFHPGPINREVEISSAVADGIQSVILNQVSFGIAVRMAVLSLMSELGS